MFIVLFPPPVELVKVVFLRYYAHIILNYAHKFRQSEENWIQTEIVDKHLMSIVCI